jgi:pyruvate/2-oxoglutarate/acetoin dehydrogenase E1 component
VLILACLQVPKADYELPLGQADILVPGTDITLIGWGTQVSAYSVFFLEII